MDGPCLTYIIVHKTSNLIFLFFLVYGCVYDHAGLDHPCIYPWSTLRYGYPPLLGSRTVLLVTPQIFYVGGTDGFASLIICSCVPHSSPHEYPL